MRSRAQSLWGATNESINKIEMTLTVISRQFGRVSAEKWLRSFRNSYGVSFELIEEKIREIPGKPRVIVTSQAIDCFFGHDLEPMTGYFKFNDFAEAPELIEDEPSINISRHLIAKSISALFPNSAKEFRETEDPRAHITTLNYPMPTIDLLDTQKTESYQLE
jgi:hypothetical protein